MAYDFIRGRLKAIGMVRAASSMLRGFETCPSWGAQFNPIVKIVR